MPDRLFYIFFSCITDMRTAQFFRKFSFAFHYIESDDRRSAVCFCKLHSHLSNQSHTKNKRTLSQFESRLSDRLHGNHADSDKRSLFKTDIVRDMHQISALHIMKARMWHDTRYPVAGFKLRHVLSGL